MGVDRLLGLDGGFIANGGGVNNHLLGGPIVEVSRELGHELV